MFSRHLTFLYQVGFLYHSPNTTWRPPCCLLCDVTWAQPKCNTMHGSAYDVIEQTRTGSQEFADWLKFSQWQLP